MIRRWAMVLCLGLAGPAVAADFDGDGLSDGIDGAPCDPGASSRWLMPAEGQWGALWLEADPPTTADFDYNEVVLAWHMALVGRPSGAVVALEAVFELRAVGDGRALRLNLRIPEAGGKGAQVDLRVAEASVPARVDDDGVDLSIELVADLSLAIGAGAAVVSVTIHWEEAVALEPASAPFDLFVEAGDEAWHRPTAGAGAWVQGRLPRWLTFGSDVPHLAEGIALDRGYAGVTGFAESGGVRGVDFYLSPGVGTVDVGAAPPVVGPVDACLPGCDDPDCRARFARMTLPPCDLSVTDAFDPSALEPPGRDSNGYRVPSEAERERFAASMVAVADGHAGRARDAAAAAGYEICGRGPTLVWRANPPGGGHAAVAWRVEGARGLIVGVPHPQFESGTRQEGLQIFADLPARAMILSGTHRCASPEASTCSGTTGVCSAQSAPFRISDMAHVVDSTYQAAHEVLLSLYPEDVAVSLHGMGSDGISLSDGTMGALDEEGRAAQLLQALLTALPGEDITSCNQQPWAPVESRLCGTTNAQGRWVHGVADACTEAASQSLGRFIHLEQSRAVRDRAAEVARAFGAVQW